MSHVQSEISWSGERRHRCVVCGTIYEYQIQRKVGSVALTVGGAHKRLERKMERSLADDSDPVPCPVCGYYQPDMIGNKRRVSGWFFFPIVFPCAIISLAILAESDSTPAGPFYLRLALGGILLLYLLYHAYTCLRWTNRGAEKRRREPQLGDRPLRIVQAEPYPADGAQRAPKISPLPLSLWLMLLATLALFAAPVYELCSGRANKDCFPPIFGPGDTVSFQLPEEIESVGGKWVSRVSVIAMPKEEPGKIFHLYAGPGGQKEWSEKISTEKRNPVKKSQLWSHIPIANDERLANRDLDLFFDLYLLYPELIDEQSFGEQEAQIGCERSLRFSGPFAGRTYARLWYATFFGGLALFLLGIYVNARTIRALAAVSKDRKLSQLIVGGIPIAEEPPPEEISDR